MDKHTRYNHTDAARIRIHLRDCHAFNLARLAGRDEPERDAQAFHARDHAQPGFTHERGCTGAGP